MDAALRILKQTDALLDAEIRRRGSLTEEELDELVDRCHAKGLAAISDMALRFRVAKAISYKSVDGVRV